MEADRQALPRLIRGSVVGDDHLMETPYGRRRVTYADCTASGRALTFLEDFIREQVLPGYANSAHRVEGHRFWDFSATAPLEFRRSTGESPP